MSLLGMFLQVVVHRLANGLLDSRTNLHIAQLGLCLALKLRLSHLDTHHGCESLLEVLGLDVIGKLGLFEHFLLVAVLLQGAAQGRTETIEVCTTLVGIDVVDKAVDGLGIARVVGKGHLDRHAIAFGNEVNDIGDEWCAAFVHPLHEFLQALVAVELLKARLAILLQSLRTQIGQREVDTRVQVAKIAQTLCKAVPLECCLGEDGIIGMEGDGGAGVLGIADDLHSRNRLAEGIFLTIYVSLATNLGNKIVRQCIDAAYTNTMQATRHLVGILVELAASMQHSHYDLKGRTLLLLMHVHRDAASVIDHLDGVSGKDIDLDIVTITGKSLIDTVIDHLTHEVVQTLHAGIANIHGRTLAHGFKTFKDLNVTGVVIVLNL